MCYNPAGKDGDAILRRLFDKTMWKYLLVGAANSLIGMGVMFALYNLLGASYWLSSAANYVVGSICSYLLNKRFTFRNRETGWKPLARFTAEILVCYLLAYGIAKPLVLRILSGTSVTTQENLAMLAGAGLFAVFNYFGQRFFVFRERS